MQRATRLELAAFSHENIALLRPSQLLKSQSLAVSTYEETELLTRAAKTTSGCLVEAHGDIHIALGDANGTIAR